MRRCFCGVLMADMLMAACFSIMSCGNRTTTVDTTPVDTSLRDTDNLTAEFLDDIISTTPVPDAADELFDDFLFNFSANRRLQVKRIVFPLPVEKEGKTSTITKGRWKMEYFFMHQDFYTLILDNIGTEELSKDTSVNVVTIEKIFLRRDLIQQYIFARDQKRWMLTKIRFTPLEKSANASFLRFYYRFAADSIFQSSSVANPITFICPDPDNDFATIRGVITPEQWLSFMPENMPDDFLYNIIYGQNQPSNSNKKILVIRGIANGLETHLTFVLRHRRWIMTTIRIST